MCTFHDPGGSSIHDLEFLGYGEIQQILFHVPGSDGPSSFPDGSYKVLEFDERARRIDLVYRNPGSSDFLPSFTLKGAGKNVHMLISGKKIVGELRCDY
jgi:hypothetical protein